MLCYTPQHTFLPSMAITSEQSPFMDRAWEIEPCQNRPLQCQPAPTHPCPAHCTSQDVRIPPSRVIYRPAASRSHSQLVLPVVGRAVAVGARPTRTAAMLQHEPRVGAALTTRRPGVAVSIVISAAARGDNKDVALQAVDHEVAQAGAFSKAGLCNPRVTCPPGMAQHAALRQAFAGRNGGNKVGAVPRHPVQRHLMAVLVLEPHVHLQLLPRPRLPLRVARGAQHGELRQRAPHTHGHKHWRWAWGDVELGRELILPVEAHLAKQRHVLPLDAAAGGAAAKGVWE
mmetsp:Transcript_38972/g.98673  ORF Transcript_38972/g.98673 Transcript_38972/m.98673 type:complete len:286 (+) Transcript_38972:50-907(+)